MKVTEFLKTVGAKVGLIRIVEEVRVIEFSSLQTRSVSLNDLMQEFEGTREENVAGSAIELSIDFDQIFQAVNLPPFQHGWNAEKVKELLNSDQFKTLKPNEAKQALLETLHKNQVPVEDIVRDAVHRDKALDSYEEFVTKKLQDRASARQQEIGRMEEQIKDCQERISEIRSSQSKDEESFKEWLQKKIEKEEDLVRVVSLIAEEPGISVGSVHTEQGNRRNR